MSKLTGMLTKDELATLVASGAIETVLVVFTDHYGRFMGKRYDAEFFLADALAHGAHACDYLLTVDMEMNPTPGYRFANWERGYGDFHLVPDLSTLRVAAWLDKTAMVLCDVSNVRTHERVTIAPRSILRKQLERAEKHGYSPMASSELEYYLFRDSFRDAAAKKHVYQGVVRRTGCSPAASTSPPPRATAAAPTPTSRPSSSSWWRSGGSSKASPATTTSRSSGGSPRCARPRW